jgi:hypothetical protein
LFNYTSCYQKYHITFFNVIELLEAMPQQAAYTFSMAPHLSLLWWFVKSKNGIELVEEKQY